MAMELEAWAVGTWADATWVVNAWQPEDGDPPGPATDDDSIDLGIDSPLTRMMGRSVCEDPTP